MNIKELAIEYKDYVIGIRREFHKYPEASWQEERTSKRIKEELTKMGIPFKEAAKTGVIAWIDGGQTGKTVALRADFDALQVSEENEVEYKSTNPGIMHACGHDCHVAMLLGAAKILKENQKDINGTIKLLFQPAEELAQGAKALIEDGCMENVDGVFGIHVWSDLDCGKVAIQSGARMASADFFDIHVVGKGGHGSLPNQGVDAVVVASAIIMNLQTLVSREYSPLEPAVVSVGKLTSGSRFNVIADKARLEGTTRCFDYDIQREFENSIRRVAEHTASAYRAEAIVDYRQGTPPVINDNDIVGIVQNSLVDLYGEETIIDLPRETGAEDFAFYQKYAKGAMAFVGVRNDEIGANFPHHHPKFKVDEEGMEIGTALYAQFAYDFLEKNK